MNDVYASFYIFAAIPFNKSQSLRKTKVRKIKNQDRVSKNQIKKL